MNRTRKEWLVEDEMTMVVVDGVPVRSYWLGDDDDRLRHAVGFAQVEADAREQPLHAVDADPIESEGDALRVHAWFVGGGASIMHIDMEAEWPDGFEILRIPG